MDTEIKHLFSEQVATVNLLAANIANKFKICSIVLFGTRMHSNTHWIGSGILTSEPEPAQLTVYILIVTQKGEHTNAREITRLVEEMQTPQLHICCIVHTTHFIQKALAEGNLFFSSIANKGILIAGNWEFTPTTAATINNYITHGNKVFRKSFTHAWRYSDEADAQKNKPLSPETIPKLRQAVKVCATTMLWILTGYRSANHTLQTVLLLLSHAGFDYQICFSEDKERDSMLFALLYEEATFPAHRNEDWERKNDIHRLITLVSDFSGFGYDYCEHTINDWKKRCRASTATPIKQLLQPIVSAS